MFSLMQMKLILDEKLRSNLVGKKADCKKITEYKHSPHSVFENGKCTWAYSTYKEHY